MSINRNQRVLLVVNQLTQGVSENDRWLYRFIENSGQGTVRGILADDYRELVTLSDQSATKERFLNALQTLGAQPTVRAIDVILMLHGTTNHLFFHNGVYQTAVLAAEIAALSLSAKLRLAYSTACYGASHTDDLVRAGFTTAIGAVGVNANAAAEFPVLLQLWSVGWQIKDALAAGESPLTRFPADEAARIYARTNNAPWADEVNSDKVLRGNDRIRITSEL